MLYEAGQTEPGALLMLLNQNQPWVKPEQIAAVPFAVIVPLPRECRLVPFRVTVVHQQIQFEMNVRALFRNSFMRVGGPAHDRDLVASLHFLARPQITSHL